MLKSFVLLLIQYDVSQNFQHISHFWIDIRFNYILTNVRSRRFFLNGSWLSCDFSVLFILHCLLPVHSQYWISHLKWTVFEWKTEFHPSFQFLSRNQSEPIKLSNIDMSISMTFDTQPGFVTISIFIVDAVCRWFNFVSDIALIIFHLRIGDNFINLGIENYFPGDADRLQSLKVSPFPIHCNS